MMFMPGTVTITPRNLNINGHETPLEERVQLTMGVINGSERYKFVWPVVEQVGRERGIK